MWDAFKIIRIKTQPKRISEILSKVSEWPTWDVDLKTATLEPPTQNLEGAKGTVVMNNGSAFPFTIQNVTDGHLEYVTPLPGCSATWYWTYSPVDQETELEMGVKMEGMMSWAYSLLLKSKCQVAFEICTANLKALAEK